MEKDNEINSIKEALLDYSDPIYIVGDMKKSTSPSVVTISATIPKEELLIKNNEYPIWYLKVLRNSYKGNSILCIRDFDKISIEEQKLFLDIITKQYFSSEKLPPNLKIIIQSENSCQLLPEIEEVIQYYKI